MDRSVSNSPHASRPHDGPGRPAAGLGRRRFLGALTTAAALATLPAASPAPRGPYTAGDARPLPGGTHKKRAARPLFIGTYTSQAGGGTGIAFATYDPGSGRITAGSTLTGVDDPSYLAVHPSGDTVYAVNEQEKGGVTAIRLSPDGPGEVLGRRDTGGGGPCHLSVHPGGRWLLSANYLSGSVAVHPIAPSGELGERTALVTHSEPAPGPDQQGPHAHQFLTSPDGGHVLAVDLGTDTVYTYRLDTTAGTLERVSYATLRPGAGPRHLTFHPSGRFAYLADELDNTVTVCAYDPASGRLTPGTPQETGTGPGTSYPAQLLVTADGAFAYLANRGHNSLTRYAVEDDGARLRLLDTVPVGGDFPRQLASSPDGGLLFAANQKSGTVTAFHVAAESGELRPAGEAFKSPMAVCVLPL
ncbi:lactonase family protein [Streptomyces monticola]|uniref:Lactonase family protein n=1 Tax=Streptomyces monticola TaxID=2666263 RepID=A0ABW2JCU7_9ACTN